MQSMFDICQANLEIVFLNISITFNFIALISPLELGVRLNNIKYLRNELITVFGWSIPKPKSKKNIVHRWHFNTFLADTSLKPNKMFMYQRFQYNKFSGYKSLTCTLQLLTENIYYKMSFGYSLLLTDIVDKATGYLNI